MMTVTRAMMSRFCVRVDGLAGFALGRRVRELAAEVGAIRPAEIAEVVEALRGGIRHGVHVVGLAGARPEWVDRDPDHEVPAGNAMLAAWHSSAVGKLALAAWGGAADR